jgi:23S rRNA (adenine2030-N6)-methyltransferase
VNYRHHFHAGNFADVMKHALLLHVLRALQRKEKGVLYLDTHAGRGTYDLAAARQGDTLARQPEWPDGIGRLWPDTPGMPDMVRSYVEAVRGFDRQQGNPEAAPRYYPGSPALVRQCLRPQDRMALCERHPEEFAALKAELGFCARCSVQEMDGYKALRAMLPPPEKRALVLIDPPFEAREEFADVAKAVDEGLARLPGGTFVVWYPLTGRAKTDVFFDHLRAQSLAPTVVVELMVAGEAAAIKLRGCGLVIINPPWQFEASLGDGLDWLARRMAQAPGGGAGCRWLVPER